jgi:hypothetical protein
MLSKELDGQALTSAGVVAAIREQMKSSNAAMELYRRRSVACTYDPHVHSKMKLSLIESATFRL